MRRLCVLCTDELPPENDKTLTDRHGNVHNVCEACYDATFRGTKDIMLSLVDLMEKMDDCSGEPDECPCTRMEKYDTTGRE